jgi:hypothetical protein
MRYQKDGIVYDEPQLREKLLDMGYNDFDFEEKAEELGYMPVGEMTAQTMPVNEEVLNEGFFQWVGMKIISWSIGILPEKELNKLWDKTLSKLKPEERKKVEDAKPSKKDKVNVLRTAIRKEYESNNSFKKKVEEASSKIKKAAKEEKTKEKDLKEEWTKYSTISFANLVVNILLFLISPAISNLSLLIALMSALGLGASLQKDFLK